MQLLEQYKLALDIGAIVSKSDRYGVITYANDEFVRISKYGRDELIGRPHNILSHPDMPKSAFKEMWDTIKFAKKPWKGIVKNRAKDGSSYWVKTLVMPLLSPENEVEEYISIRTDITEVISKEEKIQNLLDSSSRFVPKDFLKLLNVDDITNLNQGISKDMELTILFCDIRNFTTYSESIHSERIFSELNEYFSRMEPIIKENNGFVDKYIGDAIMAIFYNPENAIEASIMMNEVLVSLNFERKQKGLPKIQFGIGINSGKVTLGTVGSGNRIDTTVIGDAVNIASRLEGLTKKTQTRILVSENSLLESLRSNYYNREIGRVRVKGKSKSIKVFEIYDFRSQHEVQQIKQSKQLYDAALQKVWEKDFGEAERMFQEYSEKVPFDSMGQYWVSALQKLSRNRKSATSLSS